MCDKQEEWRPWDSVTSELEGPITEEERDAVATTTEMIYMMMYNGGDK